MAKNFLLPGTQKIINSNIDLIFEKLKQRLLGGFYEPKIFINENSDKVLSLPGLYTSAFLNASSRNRPDLSTVQSLASVTESYIDSAAEKMKAKALTSVIESLKNASMSEDFNYEKELNKLLLNIFDQTHGETKKILETELQRTKTIGLQDGILSAMQSHGVEDPTVAFITRKDKFTCKYCKEFFLQDDDITPKVYKLSELSSGYLNKKNPSPVLPPVHPNCFLFGDGRVYTDKGFKRIRNITFNDQVYTHKARFKPVSNTLNFIKTPYHGNFYEIKPYIGSAESVCVTPDHKVLTNYGMEKICDIEFNKHKLVRLVKKCLYCKEKITYNFPKLFCSTKCRDKVLNNMADYIDLLHDKKLEFEEFSANDLITLHEKSEPTFLYDITVEQDHSLIYNGLVTHNCRCVMIGVYPGFGFNSSGGLEYKSVGYDEYLHQKTLKKNINDISTIFNHDCKDHQNKDLLDCFE